MLLAAWLLPWSHARAANANFKVEVTQTNQNSDELGIKLVTVIVELPAGATGGTFTVTSPSEESQVVLTGPGLVTKWLNNGQGNDKLTLTSAGNIFRLDFELESIARQSDCTAIPGVFPWGVDVEWTGAGSIVDACVFSHRVTPPQEDSEECHSTQLANALEATTLTPDAGSPFPVATEGCPRPPVDVALVLDRSGSMANLANPGANNGGNKIEALKGAVASFVESWDARRFVETSETSEAPEDKLGIILFSSNSEGLTASGEDGPKLERFRDWEELDAGAVQDKLSAITPQGATGLGQAILKGVDLLAVPEDPDRRRRVLLVMSDGKQNRNPYIGIVENADSSKLVTYDNPLQNAANKQSVPNQEKISFYTVTIGHNTAVNAQVHEAIAQVGNGIYLHGTNATDLSTFFQSVLSRALAFNTSQPARLVSGVASVQAPVEIPFVVSSTAVGAIASVSWGAGQGELRVTATPPSGEPITMESRRGIHLPIRRPVPGTWQLRVEQPINPDLVQGPVKFSARVETDDLLIKAGFDATSASLTAADDIVLSAKLVSGGTPITGARVQAQLRAPKEAIGEILSESNASTKQPSGADPGSRADALLFHTLEERGGSLYRDAVSIQMADDGEGHDAKASDGIYTGHVRPSLPGHYQFHFRAEGQSPHSGAFEREDIASVYIRPVPSTAPLAFRVDPGDKTTSVSFTPMTSSGTRFGPGWAPYFVVRSVADGQLLSVTGGSGGSYHVRVPNAASGRFEGVELFFLDVAMVLTEDRDPAAFKDLLRRPFATTERKRNFGCNRCDLAQGSTPGTPGIVTALLFLGLVGARLGFRRRRAC